MNSHWEPPPAGSPPGQTDPQWPWVNGSTAASAGVTGPPQPVAPAPAPAPQAGGPAPAPFPQAEQSAPPPQAGGSAPAPFPQAEQWAPVPHAGIGAPGTTTHPAGAGTVVTTDPQEQWVSAHMPNAPEVPTQLWGTTEQTGPPTEQWVYADPSSYSNPYTETPVYTSGPPDAPTAVPVRQDPAGLLPPAYAATALPGTVAPPPPAGYGGSAPIAPPGAYVESAADPMLRPGFQPERGELKIKDRRAWKTWQLVTAIVIAAVVGMAINGNVGGASSSSGTKSTGYALPPPKGSTATSAAAASPTTTAASAATTTTVAGAAAAGATTTTLAGAAAAGSSSTTSPVALSPASVLVPQTEQSGNWTSPAFTIAGGTWNVGWAFQCTPAPSATPTFEIFVVNNGAAAGSTPAITSSAASGSAVTPLTTVGSQQLIVQTSAACRWAVKVTGSSS